MSIAVDWEGVILAVGGLLGMAAFIAFGHYLGRYLDEPTAHDALAGSSGPPARITPAAHLLLGLVLIAGLATASWLITR